MARRSTLVVVALGALVGWGLWVVSGPQANAATEVVRSKASSGVPAPMLARPVEEANVLPVRAALEAGAVGDVIGAEASSRGDVAPAGSPSASVAVPGLSSVDQKRLRKALKSPEHYDWSDLLAAEFMNPRRVRISESVRRECEAIVLRARPLLEILGEEVSKTTRDELGDLHAAGQAVELRKGDNPFAMVGKNVVYSTNVSTGVGLAANKSHMPRLLEVEGRLRRAGENVVLAVSNALRHGGVLSEAEEAAVQRLVHQWQ